MNRRQRKPTALLEAEKKIAELEKLLKEAQTSRDYYSHQNSEKDELLNGLHDLLDDLGVRGYRDENKYTRIPLPVRLFAWAMNNAASHKAATN